MRKENITTNVVQRLPAHIGLSADEHHLLFIGDSRVRQVYHAIRNLNMDGSDPDVYVSSDMVKDIPLLYDSPEQNLKLEYKVHFHYIGIWGRISRIWRQKQTGACPKNTDIPGRSQQIPMHSYLLFFLGQRIG